jgi:tRNA (cytidine32/uridine32-2'-O)-methyltransferase
MTPIVSAAPPLEVILADTRHAGNIGAAARFMKNMGLARLTLVSPTPRNHLEAIKMGVGAEEIIERATIVETLEEAIAPCAVTFAVTRRPRRLRKDVYPPEEAARIGATVNGVVGLVFGSEKLGLSNEQVRLCDAIVTINVSPDHPSLNLAQAVAVVVYRFRHEELDPARRSSRSQRVPASDHEKRLFFDRMVRAFTVAGFFGRPHDARTVAELHDLFGRARMDRKDVKLLLGMFKSVIRAVTGRNDR